MTRSTRWEKSSCLSSSKLLETTVEVPCFVSCTYCNCGNFGGGSDSEDQDGNAGAGGGGSDSEDQEGNTGAGGGGSDCDGKDAIVGSSADPIPGSTGSSAEYGFGIDGNGSDIATTSVVFGLMVLL